VGERQLRWQARTWVWIEGIPLMSVNESYFFELPTELIAQDPADRRGDSRLLLVESGSGLAGEMVFRELPGVLQRGDLLVLNQSRVLPARLLTRRSDTGGKVEILLVRPRDELNTWLAMARPARRLRPGVRLELLAGPATPADLNRGPLPTLEITQKTEDGMVLVCGTEDPAGLAENWGTIPLPPYIRRDEDDPARIQRAARDRDRYQTVFARADDSGAGSVAAPTAGLHFSDATLAALDARGVASASLTLHIGPGTFQPPSEEQLRSGRLHRETFHLPAATLAAVAETRAAGGRVIAVGTTSLRVLETVARLELDSSLAPGTELRFPGDNDEGGLPEFTGRAVRTEESWDVAGHTRLFIRPPQRVTAADGLLTNFHLPESSLLMLVASLMGPEIWLEVYRHAVRERMRFYSYGDCMLILPGLEKE
jgi:S-adenosylmethionine:tRNA ribosyltransferase-isomerase